MEIDEEKLISAVSLYRELYDLQNEHYMNQQRKAGIWAEIGAGMGASGNICKERWKSLRDGYHRSIKRRKTKSGDGATKNKPWRYEELMNFLRPYFQERQVKSNLSYCISSEDDSNVNNTSPSMPLLEEHLVSPTSVSTSSAMSNAITKRKMRKEIQQKSEVANVLEKYLDVRQNQTASASNPIRSFFAAMADAVLNLPPDLQLQVKNKVYLAVSEAELESQQRQHLSPMPHQNTVSDTPSPSPSTPTQMTENIIQTARNQYYITSDGNLITANDE